MAASPNNVSSSNINNSNIINGNANENAISANDNDNVPLTTDDLEEVLLELNRFEKSQTAIPNLLERYLVFVAKTGCAYFPWLKVKPLFRAKLDKVIGDFSTINPLDEIPLVPNVDAFNFAAIREKVFDQLDKFAGIPFTVQRLAELLTTPKRHYRRTDKFMRALEKNMLIVSSVEPKETNFVNGDGDKHDVNGNDHEEVAVAEKPTLETQKKPGDLSSDDDVEMKEANATDDVTAELPSGNSESAKVRENVENGNAEIASKSDANEAVPSSSQNDEVNDAMEAKSGGGGDVDDNVVDDSRVQSSSDEKTTSSEAKVEEKTVGNVESSDDKCSIESNPEPQITATSSEDTAQADSDPSQPEAISEATPSSSDGEDNVDESKKVDEIPASSSSET